MGECRLCKTRSPRVARVVGLCLDCIRSRPTAALAVAQASHARNRLAFGLPTSPPATPGGLACKRCVNDCRIGENQTGYCGIRQNVGGRLVGALRDRAKVSWYHDPLPTNCVADWVCPGGAACGYPDFAHARGPERGHANLAVFFHACSFNCLYCQNWHFREESKRSSARSVDGLTEAVDDRTSCICFFGGDPTPQMPYALAAARKARKKKSGDILRICWETNGSMAPELLDQAMDLAVGSGGCVKFDLKAHDDALHRVFIGVTNQRTLANFARAAKWIARRPTPPPLIAATLLVPGYIDATEIRALAGFIADLDPAIPYALLAFYPTFAMGDLPVTPRRLAEDCLKAAQSAGLTRVRLGNAHLLVD